MRIPNPKAVTTTEAYLAYKAEVLEQSELKDKLYHPYLHIDGWLAYWTGLTETYPTDKNGDPECLTDEEAYIAYLAGVTSEYPEALKDPADVRVASYLRYLISARFGRPDYPVTREELYLSMMKPAFIPSGDPSSEIELDGTVEAPFVDVKMYGDSFQQTYSGKNLCYDTVLESTNAIRFYFHPTDITSVKLVFSATLNVVGNEGTSCTAALLNSTLPKSLSTVREKRTLYWPSQNVLPASSV